MSTIKRVDVQLDSRKLEHVCMSIFRRSTEVDTYVADNLVADGEPIWVIQQALNEYKSSAVQLLDKLRHQNKESITDRMDDYDYVSHKTMEYFRYLKHSVHTIHRFKKLQYPDDEKQEESD